MLGLVLQWVKKQRAPETESAASLILARGTTCPRAMPTHNNSMCHTKEMPSSISTPPIESIGTNHIGYTTAVERITLPFSPAFALRPRHFADGVENSHRYNILFLTSKMPWAKGEQGETGGWFAPLLEAHGRRNAGNG